MKITKNISIFSAVVGLALVSSSCQNMDTTQRNTAAGAGIGAAAGAIIADDNPWAGAAIGAAAGGVGGHIYGKNKEEKRGY